MGFQSVPHGVQVELHGILGDQYVMNRVVVDVGHEVTTADLEDAATLVDEWFVSDIIPSVVSVYQLYVTRAVDLEHEAASIFAIPHTPGVEGAVTTAGLPASSALVTSFRTAFIGRSYRGRFYLCGLPTSQQVSVQEMADTYAAAMNANFQTLIDVLHDFGYALSVLSRVSNGVARAVGILTEVISLITNTRIDTQRRRVNN